MSLSSKAEEQGSRLVRRKGRSEETGLLEKTGVLGLFKRDGVAWENWGKLPKDDYNLTSVS